MFNSNFEINGIHAEYLKDLCELRANVPGREMHDNFKIFKSYIDAYVLCPIIGYQYSRKAKMGSPNEGNVGILAEQIINRSSELKYVYQILMLIDEESEPDKDKRIYRAFNFSEATDIDRRMIAENMQIYNEYFLGGIEVMHEFFVDKSINRDRCIQKMYEFTKNFNLEQDGEALKREINNYLSR